MTDEFNTKVYNGKDGRLVRLARNITKYTGTESDPIFIKTKSPDDRYGYGSYTTLTLEQARDFRDHLSELIVEVESYKPKVKTRVETIRDYPVGTRFTAGTFYTSDYLRIGGDKVVAINSGKTYAVNSFLNELGTKDLKVVS